MLLIVFIIFGFILLAAFIAGVAIGRTGRDQLRLELANLRGRHETLSGAYLDMKRIAGEALEAAKERHFPHRHDEVARNLFPDRSTGWAQAINEVAQSQADYIPPEEKHCPQCSVALRAESWPQECKNCHSVFGFDE